MDNRRWLARGGESNWAADSIFSGDVAAALLQGSGNVMRLLLIPRASLRTRLPFLVCGLTALVLATFLWAAHRTVEGTLARAAGDRAQAAADQVANLIDSSRTEETLRRFSTDPDIRRFLQTRTEGSEEIVRNRLRGFTTSALRRVELWDAAGTRLLEVLLPEGRRDEVAKALPVGSPPFHHGIGPLQGSESVVYSDAVSAILSEDVQSASAAPIGYVLIRSTFTENPPGIFSRLVGSDAAVRVSNKTGGIWTDFLHVVPAAAVDLEQPGVEQYRRADGQMRLGAAAHVRHTPWAVWIDFPLEATVAPARTFLIEMTGVAALFLAIATVVIGVVSTRITKPLSELSRGAEAIAGGDYSQRVDTRRHDEIGRLARAFNAMSEEVQATNQRLEARVAERTAELSDARKAADRASHAKSEFLSRMSHELRTPLNAIMGFAQVLQLDSLSHEQSDSVNHILRGGRHLLGLINEVLDVTRIESGALSLSPESVVVDDTIEQAVNLIRPLATQRGITIKLEPSHTFVTADRQRLNQILFNLLSNAVKYNRAGGTVRVSARRTETGEVEIVVADTGAGIPKEKLAMLFTPFERLGAETSDIEGTGLGLALARGLAQAMKGSLTADSVIDQGSSFRLTLPGAETAVRSIEADVARPSADSQRVGTVLYIEDNASNVALMRRLLARRPGVQLLHAPDGRTGLEQAVELQPQLVLLDLHLPDCAGEDVLRQIWENPSTREIPVVVLSADATPAQQRRLLGFGAKGYLTKPFDIGEVFKVLDQYLHTGRHDADGPRDAR